MPTFNGPQAAGFSALIIAAPAATSNLSKFIGKHNGGSLLNIPAYLTQGSEILTRQKLLISSPTEVDTSGAVATAGAAVNINFPEGIPAGVTVTASVFLQPVSGGSTPVVEALFKLAAPRNAAQNPLLLTAVADPQSWYSAGVITLPAGTYQIELYPQLIFQAASPEGQSFVSITDNVLTNYLIADAWYSAVTALGENAYPARCATFVVAGSWAFQLRWAPLNASSFVANGFTQADGVTPLILRIRKTA